MSEKPRRFWVVEFHGVHPPQLKAYNLPPELLKTKIRIDESRPIDAESVFPVIETKAYEELERKLRILKAVLKNVCGDRCAEQNPCDAKEALAQIREEGG